jgi:hypothetical protein
MGGGGFLVLEERRGGKVVMVSEYANVPGRGSRKK